MDFNADLGESFGLWERGADDALMEVISSANVAGGYVVTERMLEMFKSSGARKTGGGH